MGKVEFYRLACPCPVWIGQKLLEHRDWTSWMSGNRVCIVTDHTVAQHYLAVLLAALENYKVDVVQLIPGESSKSWDSLHAILETLVTQGYDRDSTLIALGGGVVGDVAGFAASMYMRGIPWLYFPTTLLAQVDAAIGGKTAIHYQTSRESSSPHQLQPCGLQHRKNAIGSIYLPKAVLMDSVCLQTLPAREWSAGLAEMIKYACLEGEAAYTRLSRSIQEGLNVDSGTLLDLIQTCVQFKFSLVQNDLHDHHQRRLCNLGHTLGHAIESVTAYTRFLHGEAVAIGLSFAARLSHALGHLEHHIWDTIDVDLQRAHLPTRIPRDLCLEALLEALFADKKRQQGQNRWIVLRGLGDAFEQEVPMEMVYTCLREAQC